MPRTVVIHQAELLAFREERYAREALAERLSEARRSYGEAVRDLLIGEAAVRRSRVPELLRRSG